MKTKVLSNVGASAAAVLVSISAHEIQAHHSVAMFDAENPVTVTGTINRFDLINPHSFLYVEQETADGVVEWAVEGPNQSGVARRGVSPEFLSPGATVEVCGYVLKEPATEGAYANKQVLVAEVLVLPNGEARLWSPYGNSGCREQNGYSISR